jgi:hypothetical protein
VSGLRATLIAGAVALLLALLLLGQCQKLRVVAAKASLSAATGQAALDSGKDAVGAVGAVSASASAGDAITRENERAILSAPGAQVVVDPAVRDAGLVGLCRRAAYRGDPKCVRFTPAR